MPSYGASFRESSGKQLKRMTITMPEAGGREESTVVQHEHRHKAHKPEHFRFAVNENAELAKHISKHLGIRMPGKAADESAQSAESKGNFE